MLLGRTWRAGLRFSRNSSTTATPRPRWQRYLRRVGFMGVGVGVVYTVDRNYNASALGRNLRTLWACALITADYKLNFTPEKSDQIPQLHERVAEVMFNLFTSNGGLYIKIGQAIGANAAFLPRPVQVKFGTLFDDAPQIPYSDILSVFKSEFGRPPDGPDGVFEFFDEKAIASASIAQVHKARLRPEPGETEGQWVAVKIQKPDVAKQTEWDLGVYRIVMWLFEKVAFDLPVYFVVDFISEHLRRELDFELEANNARRTAEFVAADPDLSQTVYIPRVYLELTTKRVMTAEWIDGVRLSDRQGILRLVGGALHGGARGVMEPMVELFSAQMFRWGWVHCDPHPGNVLIRPHPQRPSRPQLVLLDHGLYVQLTEDFRRDWCSIWEGMLAGEWSVVERVTRKWGVGMPDLFASAVLMRPTRLGRGRPPPDPTKPKRKPIDEMTNYERSVMMKAQLKGFLLDTDRMPKVLIFLLRNMRMVQGNNQALNSPVNRIKITGFAASRGLTRDRNAALRVRLYDYWHYTRFRMFMFSIDVVFWLSKARQWTWRWLGMGAVGLGFEDEIERSVRGLAKSSFGVDVGPEAFQG
ncbi:ABC1 domain-containing protein [Mycena indigotica]|uniref:ABC1 domain-containing protein n=1 Tax=Mycena indigotica TaxID=2126181 RepID=A0A8H6SL41_9AGAR|nr:ABC1 domain-containing protein [Mycena indigotica]KAF7300983.1 ABC1 domain-containing protein [Mycena indigotica]